MGVLTVTVHANIDVGGCTWARIGFAPDQDDWDDLRDGLTLRIAGKNPFEMSEGEAGSAEAQRLNAKITRILRMMGDLDASKPINLSKLEQRAVMKLLDNPDPRTVWKLVDARIGDRNLGKEILMERDWEGEIRVDDTQAMARFNHYTGRGK